MVRKYLTFSNFLSSSSGAGAESSARNCCRSRSLPPERYNCDSCWC